MSTTKTETSPDLDLEESLSLAPESTSPGVTATSGEYKSFSDYASSGEDSSPEGEEGEGEEKEEKNILPEESVSGSGADSVASESDSEEEALSDADPAETEESIAISAKVEELEGGKYEEDEDTDEEPDTEILRKLETDAFNDILLRYHPELKQNNYNEILAMSRVVRDSKGFIVDALHKTIPFLTKYERAKVLGLRSKQISNGSDTFIEVAPGIISGFKIALEELNQKKIPFIIRRPLPNGGSEYWKLEDLELPNIV